MKAKIAEWRRLCAVEGETKQIAAASGRKSRRRESRITPQAESCGSGQDEASGASAASRSSGPAGVQDGARDRLNRHEAGRRSSNQFVRRTEFAQMEILSSRFGPLSVDDDRVINFPAGLLGFPEQRQFALIQTGSENYFFWLQSVDDAALAFVVTDPTIFFKDYEVPVREETRQELAVVDPASVQCFVICNKVGDWLTGNLLGPIVVNAENRLAAQIVLTEKKWTTRQPLLKLQADVPLAMSA